MNTTAALIDFMSQIYKGINYGKVCAGIFVDVMKAFDTVDHEILICKLNDAGVRGVALEWFKSFLTGRKQVTKANNSSSKEGSMLFGIPQGSVLSGPLFIVFINNLCGGLFKGKLVAFADDTALLYTANTVAELQLHMQQDVNALRWWFTTHLMVMSPKTKYIIFNISRTTSFVSSIKYHEITCSLNLHDCKCRDLEQVESIKYLGLWVDSRLTWKEHLQYLKSKLVKYIRIFYMLRIVCNKQLMRSIYFAFINSKIEYGIEVWGGAYYTTVKPVAILQKAFIRIMLGRNKTDSTSPLFKELKILPIRNLYIFKVLQIFFKTCGTNRLKGLKYITLRNKSNVLVPKPKLTIFKKFYLYLAPTFFNLLPEQLKECSDSKVFKKILRNYILLEDDIGRFFNTVI